MLARLSNLPLFVVLMGFGAVAMLFPAGHAFGLSDFRTARIFLYGAVLSGFLTLLIGLALGNRIPKSVARSQLTALLAAFGLLPLMFAIPFYEAAGHTPLLHAWFEMISCFTTTGATLYDNLGRLTPSLHLWRALVGWMGGLLVWITAVAILAPLNLGGFEVRGRSTAGDGSAQFPHLERVTDPALRLRRISMALAPLYIALTGILWTCLTILGDPPFVALCHAMAVLSTSGISPVGGLYAASSGIAGEAVIAMFLMLALSRLGFSSGLDRVRFSNVLRDPELRLGLALVVVVALILVLRHGVVAPDQGLPDGVWAGLIALWGALFTALSFLTTTGFESAHWLDAQDWAGLHTPGLILLGLSLIGGGVATTAGGVKLLRIHALSRHGLRELERIVHPSSIGGAGQEARHIRRQGAYIAWVFFMLFAISVAVVMLALSLTGLQFEPAMVLTISALTTTGPLAQVAGEDPVAFAGIPDLAKMILAATMILGRMEALALIALFNPAFWRS
jgi:trk system potassium uptake protein